MRSGGPGGAGGSPAGCGQSSWGQGQPPCGALRRCDAAELLVGLCEVLYVTESAARELHSALRGWLLGAWCLNLLSTQWLEAQ